MKVTLVEARVVDEFFCQLERKSVSHAPRADTVFDRSTLGIS